jgi:hypothetical protein
MIMAHWTITWCGYNVTCTSHINNFCGCKYKYLSWHDLASVSSFLLSLIWVWFHI